MALYWKHIAALKQTIEDRLNWCSMFRKPQKPTNTRADHIDHDDDGDDNNVFTG